MIVLNCNNPLIDADMKEVYHSRTSWNVLKNKSFYITGSTGMLGSYFTLFLIWLNEIKNYSIEIYVQVRDIKKTKNIFKNYVNRQYFHIVQEDILNKVMVSGKIDYIIHAASLASPQFYGTNPVETMLPNIVGTYQLLDFAKKNSIDRVLFFSSGEVYGVLNSDMLVSEKDIGLMDFLNTANIYGESKRCGEALCHAYAIEYDINAVSVRIYHTFGPTMDIYGDKRVFSEFTSNIIDHKNIVIKSDGNSKRTFSYITDVICGLMCVLLDGQKGESYNIANESITIRELAEKLVSVFKDRNLKVIYKDRKDENYTPSFGTKDAIPNTLKLRNLGWKPSVSIEDGFKRTVGIIEYEKI